MEKNQSSLLYDIIWTIIHESIPELKKEVEVLLGE